MINFDQRIEELENSLPALSDRLADIKTQRAAHALDAINGDPKAQRKIQELDQQAQGVGGEMQTITDAIAQLHRQASAAEAEAARQERIAQAMVIEQTAARLETAGQALDTAWQQTAAALADWLRAGHALQALGVQTYPQEGFKHAAWRAFTDAQLLEIDRSLQAWVPGIPVRESMYIPAARYRPIEMARRRAAELRNQ